MKIEKVNENQIRCTLTREDLANRELKISELAYGTEKARNLFRDMMEQASFEFGFEADDIPLMIEAVPLNSECIVLVVTKVEDPEELDTRFSRFAPSVNDEQSHLPSSIEDISDEVLDLFDRIHKTAVEKFDEGELPPTSEVSDQSSYRVFIFDDLKNLFPVARMYGKSTAARNTLYKNLETDVYQLLVFNDGLSLGEYCKLCNTLMEYGSGTKPGQYTLSNLEEHYDVVVHDNALQTFAKIYD